MKNDTRFKHESLQDKDTIADLLDTLKTSIAKGKIVLEEDDHQLTLEPKGLLHLKISANQEDGQSRINLRVSWQDENKAPSGKNIKISHK